MASTKLPELTWEKTEGMSDEETLRFFEQRMTLWFLDPAQTLFARRWADPPEPTHMAAFTLMAAVLQILFRGGVDHFERFGPSGRIWGQMVEGEPLDLQFTRGFIRSLLERGRLSAGVGYESNPGTDLILRREGGKVVFNTEVLFRELQAMCRAYLAWLVKEGDVSRIP